MGLSISHCNNAGGTLQITQKEKKIGNRLCREVNCLSSGAVVGVSCLNESELVGIRSREVSSITMNCYSESDKVVNCNGERYEKVSSGTMKDSLRGGIKSKWYDGFLNQSPSYDEGKSVESN